MKNFWKNRYRNVFFTIIACYIFGIVVILTGLLPDSAIADALPIIALLLGLLFIKVGEFVERLRRGK